MSLLPEIEFSVNSFGVTIFSNYLNTPRFVPFDHKGRCTQCKSDNVDLDYAIHDTGVILYCSRLKKELFIHFDRAPMVPKDGAIVRVKSRSKAFNVPITCVKKVVGQHVMEEVLGYEWKLQENLPPNTENPKKIDELIWQTISAPPPPPPPELPVLNLESMNENVEDHINQ
jgi:hypothetical protein